MARNLDAGEMIPGAYDQLDNGIIEKYCYNDDSAYCHEYGALYQWDEIMNYDIYASGTQGICPDGFHIPTDAEWKVLEGRADSQYGVGDPVWDQVGQRGLDVALNLKSAGGWGDQGDGTDAVHFNVLPTGIFHYLGWFQQYRFNGRFWTSDKGPAHGAWYRSFNSGYNTVYRNNHGDRDSGFSLRCLKDG